MNSFGVQEVPGSNPGGPTSFFLKEFPLFPSDLVHSGVQTEFVHATPSFSGDSARFLRGSLLLDKPDIPDIGYLSY